MQNHGRARALCEWVYTSTCVIVRVRTWTSVDACRCSCSQVYAN